MSVLDTRIFNTLFQPKDFQQLRDELEYIAKRNKMDPKCLSPEDYKLLKAHWDMHKGSIKNKYYRNLEIDDLL